MKQKSFKLFKESLRLKTVDDRALAEKVNVILPLIQKNKSILSIRDGLLMEDAATEYDQCLEQLDSILEAFVNYAIIKESTDKFYDEVLEQVMALIPDPLATNDVAVKIKIGENDLVVRNNHGLVAATVRLEDGRKKTVKVSGRVTDPEALAQALIDLVEDFEYQEDTKEEIKHASENELDFTEEDTIQEADNDLDLDSELDQEPEPELDIPEDESISDEEDYEVNLDRHIRETNDKEKKLKLQVLKNIIDPKIIRKFAKDQTERNKIISAIIDHVLYDKTERDFKSEIQQQALIDFLFDLMDILLANRRIANLVAINSSVSEGLIKSLDEYEEILTEAKKNPKFTGKRANTKKKREPVDRVTPKLEMLLRLGLVEKQLYQRLRKALTAKKQYGTIPMYRNLMLDFLDDLIEYIQDDPTIYNRMRIKVMKEMSDKYLPSKKNILRAYEAGMNYDGDENSIPEEFDHYFLKDAFLKGMREAKKAKEQVLLGQEEMMDEDFPFVKSVSSTAKSSAAGAGKKTSPSFFAADYSHAPQARQQKPYSKDDADDDKKKDKANPWFKPAQQQKPYRPEKSEKQSGGLLSTMLRKTRKQTAQTLQKVGQETRDPLISLLGKIIGSNY